MLNRGSCFLLPAFPSTRTVCIRIASEFPGDGRISKEDRITSNRRLLICELADYACSMTALFVKVFKCCDMLFVAGVTCALASDPKML